MKKDSTVKTVSYIMVIGMIGKLMGLSRDMLFAREFGSGMVANAFFTASRIPRTFFDAVFASAITASFIPVFNEIMEKHGKDEAFRFSSNFISIVTVFTFLLTFVGIIFSTPLSRLFADGYDAQTIALTSKLLYILFPTVIFTGLAYSFVGILQSLGHFGIPAALSIASNGVIILYYITFNRKFGVFGLAGAFFIGWLMQALIQIPTLIKCGFRYKPQFRLKGEGMKKVWALMTPVMVSTWVQPINIMINSKYASRIDGGVSAIEYSNNLYTIIVGIFVLSITNVIFPRLSKLNINDSKDEFSCTVRQTLESMTFFLVPMTVGLMCISKPLVRFIYQWGKFTAASTIVTSKTLMFFSIGMIGYGISSVLSRAFLATQNGKQPLIAAVISIFANILFCNIFVKNLGVGGLALASSISSIVNAVALFIPMSKKYKKLWDMKLVYTFLKMCFSAVVMASIVILVLRFAPSVFGNGRMATLVVTIIASALGALVYMISAYILKINESVIVFSIIKRTIFRK